jgi:hypothetical protein
MKIAVFWVVAPCSLVEVYQRFRGTCCLHHQGDRPHRRENLKSYKIENVETFEITSILRNTVKGMRTYYMISKDIRQQFGIRSSLQNEWTKK